MELTLAFVDPVTGLIMAAVAVGLLLASRLFLKGPGQRDLQQDDRPTTLSSRGMKVNYAIGRRDVGPYFAWANDEGRFSRQESTGQSGGKGLGGGSDITQTIWYMGARHVLCPGPVFVLHHIKENGKIVWTGPINRDNTPSGSVIEAEGVGIFEIYWGELDQPLSEYLAQNEGIRSTWPAVCYIVWREKRLGTSPLWPQLEYNLESDFDGSSGLSSPYIQDDGTSRGVNGAHVIVQLLTGPESYGASLDPQYLNITTLNEVSAKCIAEHLPMNLLIQDGDDLDKVLTGVLSDLGVFMVQQKGQLLFKINRKETGSLPALDDQVILPPDVEHTIVSAFLDYNRVVFQFVDENLNYRQNDIKFDNDALVGNNSTFKNATLTLYSPTHAEVAQRIGNRRIQEPFGDDNNFKLSATYGASLLIPGNSFTLTGLGPVRVLQVKRDPYKPSSELTCVMDSYGIDDDAFLPDEGNLPPGGSSLPAANDLAFTFFEVPYSVSNGSIEVVVLRIRAHRNISGAILWVSSDGSSYSSFGQQNIPAAGGPLTEALSLTTTDVVEDGPKFESLNADTLNVLDLSSDEPSWYSGVQIAMIENEVFYLRNIQPDPVVDWASSTAYSLGDEVIPTDEFGVTGFRYVCVFAGTSGLTEPDWPRQRLLQVASGTAIFEARGFIYQLQGLIRARLESVPEAHAIGDTVFIARQASLLRYSHPIIQPGATVFVKTQPYTFSGPVAISGVTAVSKLITGIGSNLNILVTEGGDMIVSATGDRISATRN